VLLARDVAGAALDAASDAPAGTIIISESFDNGVNCGQWNTYNSTAVSYSPGHGDTYACLVCAVGAPNHYGLISTTPNITAAMGERLTGSAYVSLVPDGGVSDAGKPQTCGVDFSGVGADGGYVGTPGDVGSAITMTWQEVQYTYVFPSDAQALTIAVSAYAYNTPGDCFLLDDIQLASP
jgi:hypothetical protein